MDKLLITVNELGPLRTNCYFLTNESTRETLIIDPADKEAWIRDACHKAQLRPVALLLTHGHFDHIMAADSLRSAYGIPIYAGKGDEALMADPALNGSAMMLRKKITLAADEWLLGGETLPWFGGAIRVIATPGHTAGSLCFYREDENWVVSGDTLFKNSYGRTDFPTGNYTDMVASITEKLFSLPDATLVYPGHGGSTTLGYEKSNNPIGLHP